MAEVPMEPVAPRIATRVRAALPWGLESRGLAAVSRTAEPVGMRSTSIAGVDDTSAGRTQQARPAELNHPTFVCILDLKPRLATRLCAKSASSKRPNGH